jgi:hypothetical protein
MAKNAGRERPRRERIEPSPKTLNKDYELLEWKRTGELGKIEILPMS